MIKSTTRFLLIAIAIFVLILFQRIIASQNGLASKNKEFFELKLSGYTWNIKQPWTTTDHVTMQKVSRVFDPEDLKDLKIANILDPKIHEPKYLFLNLGGALLCFKNNLGRYEFDKTFSEFNRFAIFYEKISTLVFNDEAYIVFYENFPSSKPQYIGHPPVGRGFNRIYFSKENIIIEANDVASKEYYSKNIKNKWIKIVLKK